jgi:hypothetical protein
MKKDTSLNTVLGALLLVLLAVLALLAVRRGLAPDEKDVVKAHNTVVRDSHLPGAVVVVAMFAYMLWVVFRARPGEAKTTPPAKEPSADQQVGAPPAG